MAGKAKARTKDCDRCPHLLRDVAGEFCRWSPRLRDPRGAVRPRRLLTRERTPARCALRRGTTSRQRREVFLIGLRKRLAEVKP